MHAASLFFFILFSAVSPHCGLSPRKAALPGCFYKFMWPRLLESFSDFTKDACTHHLLHWITLSVSATLLKWAHMLPVTVGCLWALLFPGLSDTPVSLCFLLHRSWCNTALVAMGVYLQPFVVSVPEEALPLGCIVNFVHEVLVLSASVFVFMWEFGEIQNCYCHCHFHLDFLYNVTYSVYL